MPTILITGGSGLVGTALSNALLAKGYRIIILTRSVAGKPMVPNLSYAAWDVKAQKIDLAAIQAADFIVHLAGAAVVDKKWTTAYKKEIVDSRTQSSKLLVHALSTSDNHVKAVIGASAIGWYGADKEPPNPFTEEVAATGDFLGSTCERWEESIEPVANLGIRLVKFRIGIVLSRNGGALAEFIKPVRLGIAAILGSGKQVISWVHINDLANLFIAAVENEKLQGTYNAVAPNPVTNKTLTTQLAQFIKGKFFIPFYVPAFILKLVLGQRSVEVLKSTTVSSQKIRDTGFEFEFSTIDEALSDLIKK